jgi:hypothetical protein
MRTDGSERDIANEIVTDVLHLDVSSQSESEARPLTPTVTWRTRNKHSRDLSLNALLLLAPLDFTTTSVVNESARCSCKYSPLRLKETTQDPEAKWPTNPMT